MGPVVKRIFSFFAVWFLCLSSLYAQSINTALEKYYSENYSSAFSLFLPLAEGGNTEAQAYLGQMYFEGKGTVRNDAKAVRWFSRAAEQGSAQAQYALSFFYRTGRGVRQSDEKAAQWLEKAARQGHQAAQYDLSALYLSGVGVPKDQVKALMWRLVQPKGGNQATAERLPFVKKMTREDIEMARWSAMVCRRSDYVHCD